MQAPLKNKDDIKIFILYLMENIGYPLEFNTLSNVMQNDNVVGYFEFAECFAELLDAGHIVEEKQNSTDYYRISDTGSHVADQLQSNLLGIIRNKSLQTALRFLSFQKRGVSIKCTYDDMPDLSYNLTCCIHENNSTMMSICVNIKSKYALDRMMYNFDKNPELVYRGVLALLSGEVNYLA